jgi:GNAT acetyltransferase-like protein
MHRVLTKAPFASGNTFAQVSAELQQAPEFHASCDRIDELACDLASLDRCNPFRTPRYVQAMRALGQEPWLFFNRVGENIVTGCIGFLQSGRLNRTLEIPSIPPVMRTDPFWQGLQAFCREHHVSRLSLQSFGSAGGEIGVLESETERQSRTEYVLDLQNQELWSKLSSNHRRNMRKAQEAGLFVERTFTPEACAVHARLRDASMERRANRGEQVPTGSPDPSVASLVENRAGEIFRVSNGSEVLSSILVLRAEKGAYYHSAGTRPDGMAVGASHFLVRNVAETLRAESVEVFILGAAGAGNPGLERFKTGFGPRPVTLEAANFDFANPLKKTIGSVVSLLRRSSALFLNFLMLVGGGGNWEQVYPLV